MGKLIWAAIIASIFCIAAFSAGPPATEDSAADARIRKVLENHQSSWGGINVPEVDGRALYDIVIQHGYKNALEIGTSNGYSGLWIAWALSKTGGKLITIEIDRGRHDEAVAYFRQAGLEQIVDARLGNAHDIVPALTGAFDFVFCDADKDWYENYLKAALPKISVGGCFAAHNIVEDSGWDRRSRGGSGRGFGVRGFLEYARSFPNLDTRVLDLRGSAGLSVSYKKSEK